MSNRIPDVEASLAEARAGSPRALGELLEACRNYLLTIAGDELDPALRAKGSASDLVQQTFLEAYRDFGRFQGASEDELLAWLRRMLLNNLMNFTRDFRDTGKRALDREVSFTDSDSYRPLEHLAADSSTPSGKAVRQEEEDALNRAVAKLPEEYREVLRLRFQEHLGFEEIADRLGKTANAARKLWGRAVERLQEDMAPPP